MRSEPSASTTIEKGTTMPQMKLCRYCAEEIQETAIKCRYCGEFLDGEASITLETDPSQLPWYFKTPFILLMLASAGPFALPLIWWHPQLARTQKWIFSLIVLILTALLLQASIVAWRTLCATYQELLGDF